MRSFDGHSASGTATLPLAGPVLAALCAPLVLAASRPYATFVHGDDERARAAFQAALLRPSSEVALDRVRAVFEGPEVAGLVITVEGANLARCRLADSVAMLAAQDESRRAAFRERLRITAPLWFSVPADTLYLSKIAVRRDRRARGLGAKLMTIVFDQAERRGLERVCLDVASDNSGALALYERFGFSCTGERAVETSAGRIAYRRLERCVQDGERD